MGTQISMWNGLEAFSFGNSPAMADELGALVVAGTKTATCWAARDGQLTQPGKRMVMHDGQGRGWAVLETLEVTPRRFGEVDAAFAWDEGEGDRTLDSWRDGHRRYFTAEGSFAPDMELWCERFRLVDVLEREGVR
jgi:uncharacterized protein YhfF